MKYKLFNPCSNGIQKYFTDYEKEYNYRNVLILVLMEYENTSRTLMLSVPVRRLNPCSNGILKYALLHFLIRRQYMS